MSSAHTLRITALAGIVVTFAACGGGESKQGPQTGAATTPGAAAPSVKPTGKIITVEMTSDEKGNYFTPNKLEVHRGDVLRFTLKTGVHNVHFLPDSNPGKTGLPPASDFLQIPGQTWDYLVDLGEGHYVFQCDPHAALGMMARLEVEDEKH